MTGRNFTPSKKFEWSPQPCMNRVRINSHGLPQMTHCKVRSPRLTIYLCIFRFEGGLKAPASSRILCRVKKELDATDKRFVDSQLWPRMPPNSANRAGNKWAAGIVVGWFTGNRLTNLLRKLYGLELMAIHYAVNFQCQAEGFVMWE